VHRLRANIEHLGKGDKWLQWGEPLQKPLLVAPPFRETSRISRLVEEVFGARKVMPFRIAEIELKAGKLF
jgi:hypothetical protein